MEDIEVIFSEQELRDKIREKERREGHPHAGEARGMRFVLQNMEDTEKIVDELRRLDKKTAFWYSTLHATLRVPIVSGFVQRRAWKYDEKQVGILKCLNVMLHADGPNERVVLKKTDTEEPVMVLRDLD